jgi:3-oxoadipate enol-lactonase
MFALIHDLSLHYQLEGAPRGPALVWINSLGCDLRIWDALIPAFADSFHILRYDKRGHGLSDTPPGPYTIREHSEDIWALLNVLELRDPILVGLSVGGLIAMDAALLHPGAVRALVLADTAPQIGTPSGWSERIRAVSERGLDGMAESILSRWFVPSFAQNFPALYRGYANMLSRAPADGYLATCAALRDTDLSSTICGALAIPALILCGAEDPVVTPAQTRAWAAAAGWPRARVEIIPGTAHLPCIEQPEAMGSLIHDFLRKDCHVG